MAITFPKVPFPGPGPANPTITYGGATYTFDAGLLTQRVGNWVAGTVTDRWRLYDYENAHLITDQEAQLLGVKPEVLIVTNDILGLAEADAYIADTVLKNLGSAIVATLLPRLTAANAGLAKAQQQLSVDTAALTAASTANDALAGDQTALTGAETAAAADAAWTALNAALTAAQNASPPNPQAVAQVRAAFAANPLQQAIAAAQNKLQADTAAAAPLATLTVAVNATDPAAVTAAQAAITAAQAAIAQTKSQFA